VGPCQVTVACGSEEEAARVVDALVDGRLAACVQVLGPVRSHYRWQGARESAAEWLCLAKSRLDLVDDLVAAVRAVHSYETPEIVAVPIVAGDPAYLAWLEGETGSS
jgi:periplasmic divalent cation tolerance protein